MHSPLTNKQLSWFCAAQKMAQKHDSFGRYKIVALLVKSNRVISVGYNYYSIRRGSNSPLYKGFGIHAEFSALIGVDSKGATLYVAGYSPHNNEICTEPCDRCKQIIGLSQIKQVIYMNHQKELEVLR